jgi:hypothetical protein
MTHLHIVSVQRISSVGNSVLEHSKDFYAHHFQCFVHYFGARHLVCEPLECGLTR